MATVIGFIAELIRIVVTLTRPISDRVLDVLWNIWIGPTRKLPPIDNKILLMTATELAEKIRKRQISCEEVMRAYIERSRAVHWAVNAVVDDRYVEALEDAKDIDRQLASGAKSEEEMARDTPLLGLPFSCKEVIGVKGMTQTSGLLRAKGRKAEKDSDSAALYRKAGAIPVTVTNNPELSMWWETYNLLLGWTRNPYDNRRTVGGSSGGEGALITSAGSLFGIGHDIAGSIRIPASFCGIYGHKSSRDIVPNYGPYPYSQEPVDSDKSGSLCSTGPLCRYAQDLSLLLKVLSENDERLNLNQKINFKSIKLYFIEEFPGILFKATPEVKKAVRKVVNYFQEEYNVKAVPLRIPELRNAYAIWESKLFELGAPPISHYLADKGQGIHLHWELLRNLLGCPRHTVAQLCFAIMERRQRDSFFDECLRQGEEVQRMFDIVFRDENAVVVLPTHPEPAPHYLMTIPKFPNTAYTGVFNVLGLPVTHVPAGLSSGEGLPFGVQVVGGRFRDHLTVTVAQELDKLFGGWKSPCAVVV